VAFVYSENFRVWQDEVALRRSGKGIYSMDR